MNDMSQTTVNLGYVPKNRGEYSSTASYYKDNIVQYNGSSYICNPPNYDPDTAPTASITGVAPYASDPAVPNTGWAVFCNDSSGVGEGVYDVSVGHTTDNQPKKYADLSAALQDVPQAKQKGGMTIRFIQTYDNKYVQWRYMGTEITGSPNPFLDTANWQGVDEEPTTGSDNLVKSGGVAKHVEQRFSNLDNLSLDFLTKEKSFICVAGSYVNPYIDIKKNTGTEFKININGNYTGIVNLGITYTDNTVNAQSTTGNNVVTLVAEKPTKLVYAFINSSQATDFEGVLHIEYANSAKVVKTIDGLQKTVELSNLNRRFGNDITLAGNDIKSTVGYGIDYDTGDVVESSYSTVSDLISCVGRTTLNIVERYGNNGLVFYDSNGNKIKPYERNNYATSTEVGIFLIPYNAVSFRIATSSAHPKLKISFNELEDESSDWIERICGYKVINDKTIEQNVIDNSNFYDKNEDLLGFGIDYSTGALVENPDLRVSKRFEVTPNSFYQLNGRVSQAAKGIVGYDTNGDIIHRSLITDVTTGQCFGDSLNGIIKTGEDVVAFRFTTDYSGQNNLDNISLIEISENLYNKNELIIGGLRYDDGSFVDADYYKTTPFIKLSPYSVYILSGRINTTSQGLVGYDAQKNIIQRNPINGSTGSEKFGEVTNGIIHTGNDIAYIRFTCYSSFNSRYTEEEQLANIEFKKADGLRIKGIIGLNKKPLVAEYYQDENGVHSFGSDEYIVRNPTSDIYNISGKGTALLPFKGTDGAGCINLAIEKLIQGGKVRIPSATFLLDTPILINKRSINIEGDSWNYPNDPNGVYASVEGSKLKVEADGSGLLLNDASGTTISNIGFQGQYTTGEVKGTFSRNNPLKNAGICSSSGRNDQMQVSRVSCQGLSAGFSITPNGDIDASLFERLNADGCNISFFFSPKQTYYAKVRDSIFADCPAFGVCVVRNSTIEGAKELTMLTIDGIVCVRNGGGFTPEQLEEFENDMAAGMLVSDVTNSMIINNQIDNSGTYWDTTRINEDSGDGTPIGYLVETSNSHDIIRMSTGLVFDTKDYVYNCHGLILKGRETLVSNNRVNRTKGGYALKLIGNNNSVVNNIFNGDKGIFINGSSNNVTNNTTDGEIDISGNNNKFSDIMISENKTITVHSGNNNLISNCRTKNGTYPNIIIEAGVTNTVIEGIPQNFVTDNGSGTIIK